MASTPARAAELRDEMTGEVVAKLREDRELPPGWGCPFFGSFFTSGRYAIGEPSAPPAAVTQFLWNCLAAAGLLNFRLELPMKE